jgi:hypothetical protein
MFKDATDGTRVKHTTFITLLITFVFGSAACGKEPPPEDNTPDMSTEDAGLQDQSTSDAEDAGPQFVCPNEGEEVCDGKCVNVLISMDHCGECWNECQRGSMTCGGEDGCLCLDDREMCGGRCWDTQTSRLHCGECDNDCAMSQACVSGECIEISDDPIVLGVLSETNAARAEGQDCGVHGVKPPADGVQLNEQLNAAAQRQAEDMAANNFMDHEGSDGSHPADRTADAGYPSSYVGENVARGYETAEGVVAGWVDSDGHCQNLMNPEYTEMGVGHAISQSTGEHFWAQVFGRP